MPNHPIGSALAPVVLPPNNVTVVGAFNPAILRPDWVGRKVFRSVGPTEVFVAAGGGPVLQRRDEITWWVQQDRLVVAAEGIERAAQFTEDVLRVLPHTPVQAAGINFQRTNVLPLTGHWFKSLQRLKAEAGALNGKPFVGVTLRANRSDRTTVTVQVQELELPSVTFDFNFSRDAFEQEEEQRVQELVEHLKLAKQFEQEASEMIARVCNA